MKLNILQENIKPSMQIINIFQGQTQNLQNFSLQIALDLLNT